jgi:hypothetical protein
MRVSDFLAQQRPHVGFITTASLWLPDLVPLWKDLVLTPDEARVVDALRLVEPDVERIAISGAFDTAGAQVLLRGASAPIPLGSLGEGVSRILALALHLVSAPGGVVLVDEIENGLHWSVMPTVWRFLVETARTLDVQVFVTTHSKDWLQALVELHSEHPDLADNVSAYRLEAGRPTAVRFTAQRIAEYVAMELEARG